MEEPKYPEVWLETLKYYVRKQYPRKLVKNLWFRASSVFLAMVVSDFIWARYIGSVAAGYAVESSIWSAVVVLIGAFVVVSYIEDRRLITPAVLGAAIGTYFGT